MSEIEDLRQQLDDARDKVKGLERQRDEARKWLLSISVVPAAPAANVQESVLEGARILRPLEETKDE